MAQSKFQIAAEVVMPKHKDETNDDQKLAFYGFFKQATVGDNNTAKPGMFDFKGKAKWEAWNKNKGLTKEQAEQGYVDLVKTLFPQEAKNFD